MSAPCPLFGFMVSIGARGASASTEVEALVRELEAIIRANGLSLDRASFGARTMFTVTREGSQATHADRELLLSWSGGREHLADIEISDLMDLAADGW